MPHCVVSMHRSMGCNRQQVRLIVIRRPARRFVQLPERGGRGGAHLPALLRPLRSLTTTHVIEHLEASWAADLRTNAHAAHLPARDGARADAASSVAPVGADGGGVNREGVNSNGVHREVGTGGGENTVCSHPLFTPSIRT